MNEYYPFGVYNRNRENKMGEVFSGKVVLIIKFGFFGGEVSPPASAGRVPVLSTPLSWVRPGVFIVDCRMRIVD
jgi:hypothetical protein